MSSIQEQAATSYHCL